MLQPSLLHAANCTPTVSSGGSIQSAVDSAVSGDTICIGAGTYTETLTLEDGVILEGEELARTIIDGNGTTGAVITGSSLTSGSISNIIITNGTTGISFSDSSGFTISNVIIVGNSYGIYLDGSTTSVTVSNSVIDQNTTSGIYLANSSTITITNSILTGNSVDIGGDSTSSYTPSYNLVYNNTTANYSDSSNTSVIDSDPLFVDTASYDYHLKSGSPAKDTGSGTDPDGTTADIGAYGGSGADVAPFPVTDLSASASGDNTLLLTWSANSAYNIAGYKIYFDSDASGESYDGSSTEGLSPIDAGNTTSYTLSGLTLSSTAPSSPSGLMATPGNASIALSWNAASSATGYIVYWGTSSGNYTQSQDVGNWTSYTVPSLTNGTTYYFAVSAYNDTTYYLLITVYDTSDNESAVLSANEVSATLSNTAESSKSTEVSEYPEESVAFPNLKNEGLCFIATAVYGSNREPDVIILRSFRNHYLLTNPIGRIFTAIYYRYSPPFADFIRDHETLKLLVRIMLFPFVIIARFALFASLTTKLFIAPLFVLAAAGFFIRRVRNSP